MSGRVAIVALVASAGVLACEPPTGAESDETLWVGVFHAASVLRDKPPGSSQHDLWPFARWDGTAWRKAWIESSARIEVAVDSLGRVDARAVESLYPLDWSDRNSPRIAPPPSWVFFRLADDVATGPGDGVVARVSGLLMVGGWRLGISGLAWDAQRHDAQTVAERQAQLVPRGVAFSRRPDEVLAESDVPGLPDVEASLGLERSRWGDESVWRGLFRYQDATYGVAYDRSRGSYHLVRIDGERSRSLVQFRRW